VTVPVGFSFPPDHGTLDRCAPIFEAVDYLSVVPETLVGPRATSVLTTNSFYDRLLGVRDTHGVAVVAHGLSLSPCTTHPADGPRFARWLDHVGALQERLGFLWYTDHFGWTAPGGLNLTLPLPVPHVQRVRDATRARLAALAAVTACPVGLENSVFYTSFAPIEQAGAFLADALGPHHLLLDVHNLWVDVQNLGLDLDRWLDALPLGQVIELHVSGGVQAPAAWGGQRLDSHDAPVPEPVWDVLDRVLARCPNVRGVTLERLEGTIAEHDVDGLLGEVDRVRAAVARATPAAAAAPPPCPPWPDEDPAEVVFADAWSSADPRPVFAAMAQDPRFAAAARSAAARALADPAGLLLAHKLVLRLRFDRLLAGSPVAAAFFEHDPAGFARAFARYVAAVPPTAFHPREEALAFRAD
jgi:uncharacterized protein (UPF0276 family)